MIISLYIHIPFCASKCAYCDFYSVPLDAIDSNLIGRYFAAVIDEISSKLQSIQNPVIDTVFLGGGTPSAVPLDILENFLDELYRLLNGVCSEDLEFTTEANVESCSTGFLELAASRGINRLSLGVQSFNSEVLRNIGRACFPEAVRDRVELVKEFWHERFSFDIISGVDSGYLDDIETALKIDPGHISVYQLTLEEGTLLNDLVLRGEKKRPDETLQAEAIAAVNSRLSDGGYSRYEISNYCRSGNECRHNLKYWNMQSYIGAGASAVSSFYDPDRKIRITNTPDLDRYITEQSFSEEVLSDFDFLIEHYIMGCRLISGIDNNIFKERFGMLPHEIIPRTTEQWTSGGYLDPGEHILNERGLILLDNYLCDVYAELEKKYKK